MTGPGDREAQRPDRRPARPPAAGDQPGDRDTPTPAGDGAGAARRSRTWAVFSEHGLEALAAILLALVALATAWSGYQAARWSGVQATQFSVASAMRVEATQAAARAGQAVLYDLSLVDGWFDAQLAGRRDLAGAYEARFRDEFRPTFAAWLALDPLNNPSAPRGPLLMPGYKPEQQAAAERLEEEAGRAFAAGQAATQTSNSYVLNGVLLAVVLFCVTIARGFAWAPVRLALLAVGGVTLLYCLVRLGLSPVT